MLSYLYGYYCKDQTTHLGGDPDRLLWRSPDKRTSIFMEGEVNERVLYQDGNDCCVFQGRLYAPVSVNARQQDCATALKRAIQTDETVWDGNYVMFRFSTGGGGGSRLTISTDRFASRPVYYCETSSHIFFSTHIKGVQRLRQNGFDQISKSAFFHFFHFGQSPNDRSLIDGIAKIPPENQIECIEGTLHIKRNRPLSDLYQPKEFTGRSEGDIADILNERVSKSVAQRCSDLDSVGLTLSGGVDSGYVAIKLKNAGIKCDAFNLSYEDDYNENDRLDWLSKRLDIPVHKKVLNPKEILEIYGRRHRLGSEPLSFNDALIGELAQFSSEMGHQTLFEGGGADHLFLGMSRYLKYFKLWRIYNKVRLTGIPQITSKLALMSKSEELRKLGYIFSNWTSGIPPYPKRIYAVGQEYDERLEKKIFGLKFKALWEVLNSEFSSEDIGLFFTICTVSMDPEEHFIPPFDQQAPYYSFPVSPFWSLGVVSLALSVPFELKVKNGMSKHILRLAAEREFDREYWQLPKIGLQDSYTYLKSSKEGKIWVAECLSEIKELPELEEVIGNGVVDDSTLERLIPYYLWKNEVLNVPSDLQS